MAVRQIGQLDPAAVRVSTQLAQKRACPQGFVPVLPVEQEDKLHSSRQLMLAVI